MKLATVRDRETMQELIVLSHDGRCSCLLDLWSALGLRDGPATMLDLIELAEIQADLLARLANALPAAPPFDIKDAQFLPPVRRPSKIIGVAFNNKELMKTAFRDPGVPNFFLKPPSALIGDGDAIRVDPQWGAVIAEPEICAVIARRCKNLTDDEALGAVFGYSILNDVTSHGLKFQKDSISVAYPPDLALPEFYRWRRVHGPEDRDAHYVYHTRSKGTDTFGPVGPWLTTRDEVANPNVLNVVATIDGEVFARDSTSNYRFAVQRCIAEASRYFTLEPGDMITFGTTGKGEGRFPRGHKSLLLGEVTGRIAIEVDQLGRLENPVEHFDSGT
jgi:2-keto-4-pentenoate hydratase/2-oxohepta-3-ene-1,7-dioic acid hydratase in catechol pathway